MRFISENEYIKMIPIFSATIFHISHSYLNIFNINEVSADASAMIIIGMIPVIVTHGTSSSATLTTMRVMMNENAPKVRSRIGKVKIRNTVPSVRFTSPSITEKRSAAGYPPEISIPGIFPDRAMK